MLTEAQKQYRKEDYKKNPEKYKERARRWKANPKNAESLKLSRKKSWVKTYGISWEDYENMYYAQKGQCKICQTPKELFPEQKTNGLYVDHCHSSNEVRGLLCGTCNAGLGMFKDNPEFLKRAVEYINGS
jgi:hypothetical protein